MITVTKELAKETFNAVIDGETVDFQIVPQMSSSLRRNLVFWQMEKPDGEEGWRRSSEKTDGEDDEGLRILYIICLTRTRQSATFTFCHVFKFIFS